MLLPRGPTWTHLSCQRTTALGSGFGTNGIKLIVGDKSSALYRCHTAPVSSLGVLSRRCLVVVGSLHDSQRRQPQQQQQWKSGGQSRLYRMKSSSHAMPFVDSYAGNYFEKFSSSLSLSTMAGREGRDDEKKKTRDGNNKNDVKEKRVFTRNEVADVLAEASKRTRDIVSSLPCDSSSSATRQAIARELITVLSDTRLCDALFSARNILAHRDDKSKRQSETTDPPSGHNENSERVMKSSLSHVHASILIAVTHLCSFTETAVASDAQMGHKTASTGRSNEVDAALAERLAILSTRHGLPLGLPLYQSVTKLIAMHGDAAHSGSRISTNKFNDDNALYRRILQQSSLARHSLHPQRCVSPTFFGPALVRLIQRSYYREAMNLIDNMASHPYHGPSEPDPVSCMEALIALTQSRAKKTQQQQQQRHGLLEKNKAKLTSKRIHLKPRSQVHDSAVGSELALLLQGILLKHLNELWHLIKTGHPLRKENTDNKVEAKSDDNDTKSPQEDIAQASATLARLSSLLDDFLDSDTGIDAYGNEEIYAIFDRFLDREVEIVHQVMVDVRNMIWSMERHNPGDRTRNQLLDFLDETLNIMETNPYDENNDDAEMEVAAVIPNQHESEDAGGPVSSPEMTQSKLQQHQQHQHLPILPASSEPNATQPFLQGENHHHQHHTTFLNPSASSSAQQEPIKDSEMDLYDLIYIRNSTAWTLPDVTEQLATLTKNKTLRYTAQYEKVLIREIMDADYDIDDIDDYSDDEKAMGSDDDDDDDDDDGFDDDFDDDST